MNDERASETAAAAELVTSVAPRRPVREALEAAGLELLGPCEQLSLRTDLLRESPFLQDFSPGEADILGRAMLRVRAQPGQLLIAEDDPSDWMLLLVSGTLDVFKRRVGTDPAQGEVERVAVLRPGATVGEMSMLDGEPRYASCRALGEVEAGVLTRAAVAELISEQPAVGAKVLVKITQLLAQRLRNTANQLLRQLQKP
jgi:CRP-like cAMP-binding protein